MLFCHFQGIVKFIVGFFLVQTSKNISSVRFGVMFVFFLYTTEESKKCSKFENWVIVCSSIYLYKRIGVCPSVHGYPIGWNSVRYPIGRKTQGNGYHSVSGKITQCDGYHSVSGLFVRKTGSLGAMCGLFLGGL